MNKEAFKTIIFLHIPKTAGRTFNGIIRSLYRPGEIFSNGQAVMSRLGRDWGKTPAAKRWEISGQILAELPEEKKRNLKVIFGHMNFGRHVRLPQPCTYVTLLRHPVERIVSHYYHILRMKDHHLYHTIVTQKMTVGDYVESGITFTVDNGQTRMIAGVGDSVPYGKCTADILDTARRNLENYFSIVGLTREFDKTLILVKRMFNWNIDSYETKNVSRDRPSPGDIPLRDRQIIERYNQLDTRLYEYARQLFEKLVQRQDSSFEQEVKQLRKQNINENESTTQR